MLISGRLYHMSVFVGKNAIVTGGNAGLGLQTKIELTKLGFHVTITGIRPLSLLR